ncbi:hypothetical protein RchiOBHm_Chr2g0143871 [Rosa chinensis]|uniref:Uncharacterized protein n=1 Tax=Rosa chinensis TaxID=74649 RepID=A0A2P6RY93_ROSCH|nr:hypothetical protein RchiOBHm_Chr2g0143871 [Rosa chinensis]
MGNIAVTSFILELILLQLFTHILSTVPQHQLYLERRSSLIRALGLDTDCITT